MTDLNKIEIIDSLDGELDWSLKAINVKEAWKYTKGENVRIATMDTGININHPDLKGNIKSAINMFNKTADVTDVYGHGTVVGGLLVGKNTGIAPNAELYVAKVLDDSGYGNMASILDGITFAINHNVDILCMSLGTSNKLPLILEERIELANRHGIIIVCASGNSNKRVEYPANYDNIIGVGGVDKSLERASFSNYGWGLDIVAPSEEVLSTYKDGNWVRMSGTSMASPIVAGAIALIISYHRSKGIFLTTKEIKYIFSQLGNKTEELGHGFIDLAKLFEIIKN